KRWALVARPVRGTRRGRCVMAVILVIDDSAIVREPLARLLQLMGHTVFAAVNGREARYIAATQVADIVVLEPFTAGGEGVVFLRWARQEAAWKEVPFIVLTDAADRERLLTVRTLGVTDYLLKSHFSLEELLARIDRRLRGEPGKPEMPKAAVSQPQRAAQVATISPANPVIP